MKFQTSALIPLVAKLGGYLRNGFDHYVMLKASGIEPDADMIAMFISSKMDNWNPKMKGFPLFDDDTKSACARFAAGVALNMAAAQSQKDEKAA